jgi:Flp pilus assembly protein TadB
MLIIVCIFIVLGSMAAWRASPLYSLKSTLQLVAAFLLIVAAIVGASMAIFSGPVSRSPVAQGILGGIAFLVISIGASVSIVRITDKHVAQLPSSVKIVSLHRHKMYKWFFRMVIFLLLCAAAALVLPGSWNWGPLALGGFILLASGPSLGLGYMMARRNDRAMTAVIANPWVHWQYTPEQWNAWVGKDLEWERKTETPWSWKKAILFDLFIAGLFALGALFTGGGFQENLIIFCSLNALVVLMTLILFWVVRTHPARRKRKLLAAPPEAYFGDEGVFCEGGYMQWILSGRFLLTASLATDPATCVVLVFESFNGSTSTKITKRIPIPPDRIQDQAILQQKIGAACPTAHVRLLTPSM